MACLVDGQQQVRPDEDLAAPWGGQLHVISRLRNGTVRDGAEAVGKAIGATEHTQYAGHGKGRRRVDTEDLRMRMGRANYRGIGLSLDAEIVAEAAFAGQQPNVLLAQEGLPDSAHADSQLESCSNVKSVCFLLVLALATPPGRPQPRDRGSQSEACTDLVHQAARQCHGLECGIISPNYLSLIRAM